MSEQQAFENEQPEPDNGKDFKLERYKYILQELRSLSDRVYKYLTLFQTLTTAIVAGGVAVFVGWKSLKISAEMAIAGIQGLLGLLVILAVFVVISILAGMFSWFDYRREEVRLLDETVRPGYRKAPEWGNWWRWSETHILILVVCVTIIIHVFAQYRVIPLIQ